MKKILPLLIVILVHSFTIAQSPIHYEKTIISNNGLKKLTKEIEKPINNNIITLNTNSKNPEIQIIWSGIEDIST
ncbi:MAG: hypothetical protein GQ527_06190 [Bacteroidales bacterium]|nr:hypothetical protein [Bacteroidales bacterium]